MTVSWQTRNATTIDLRANGNPIDLGGASAASGSIEVVILADTEFVLSATGGGGQVESDPRTVTVRAPQILSFEASPESFDEGDEITLSWRTAHAQTIRITDSAGALHDLQGQSPAEGSIVVTPPGSVTYTLVAEAGPRSDEAEVSVQLRGAPSLEVTSSTGRIDYGGSVTFTWAMQEGETLRIQRDDETVLESPAAQGTFTDEPRLSATYRFTAERAGKTTQETAVVEVMPVVVDLTVPDEPTPVGQEVEVRWHVGGARELLLSNGGDFEETIQVDSPDEGSRLVPLGPDGSFELVARSGALRAEQTAMTPVLATPAIGSFAAHADVVSAHPGEDAHVTLSWTGVERAHHLELVGDTTGVIALPDGGPDGSVEVAIAADTSFTLRATNPAGEVEAHAAVRVVPFPSIDLLTAQPRRVASGEAFLLSWATTGADAIDLTANGRQVPGVHRTDFIGSISLQIAMDTTYVLVAANDAGDLVEQEITVTVGAPQNLSFDAAPSYAPAGGTVTFTWTNLGGSLLTLTDADGSTVCSTSDVVEIEAGSCATIIADEGLHTFTLTVTDTLGGEDVSTVDVVTSTGPWLLAFTGSSDRLTVGETLTFSWDVHDDPFGEAPTLSLSDGTNSYDLSDADPNQGSKGFAIDTVGDSTFTFTASTAAGTKTATHQATVHGVPSVTLVASPTQYDGTTPVTLSWTSEHADGSLRIFLLDDAGAPIEPALHESAAGDRNSGSHDVVPTRNGTYRIVATNGAGMEAIAEASVTLAPPTIVSFEAVPDEVIEGDEVTLSWTTRMADSIFLSVVDGLVVEEVNSPFVDIRTLGAVTTTFTINPCGDPIFNPYNEGCSQISFPQGFTFPFGGTNHSSIVMYANGFLGFSLTTIDTYSNRALTGSNTHVALAPFWDDVEGSLGTYHHLFGTDDRGQYLILQWSGVELYDYTSTLHFQVVLWEDGAFEFRYGSMSALTQSRADGSSATIGYQFPDGSHSYTLHQGATGATGGTAMAGGLSNRSWRFSPPALEPNGSFVLTAPAEDLDVTLTAEGPGGSATADLSIVAHPRATVAVTWPTEEIDAGQPFTISWTTSHASAVEVLDDQGVRCTAAPGEVETGSCELTEAVPGTYTYTVTATGALGHQVDAVQELLDGTEPLAAGTFVHRPQAMTTYVFTVHSADERSRSASEEVTVRTFLFELASDLTEVAPGTPVTITWDVTSLTGETPLVTGDWPLLEVTDGSAAFEDVSALGQSQLIGTGSDFSTANFTFPEGFEFPFYEQAYSAIRVGVDGWISFDTSASWESTNRTIPNTTYRRFHLPIFWDDLYTDSGRVDAVFLPNPDRVVVQWTNVARYFPTTRGYDLNFQIVLFPDGRFEYRYGTMAPPTTPATDPEHCTPLDCTEETQGSSATIGYQDPDGLRGFQLHYGGPAAENHAPFPGGLSNRSFRFETPASNSLVVVPTDSGSYEVCVELGGFRECKTVAIDATWGIDGFTANTHQIDAQESVTLSWLTTNAENLTLTANGVDVDISTLDFDDDSIVLWPEVTTTYELTLHSLGRQTTKSLTVAVRQAELQVTGPSTVLFPGEVTTISWSATPLGTAPVFVYGPMQEITTPFTDISTDPNVQELIGSGISSTVNDHSFADGFEFPYQGEVYTSVRVSPDGYLSFDTSTSNSSDNNLLPSAATAPRRVHLAPFWDDLHTRSSGRVHALRTGDGGYVIQWSHVSKETGSSNSNEYDLNFQVVLFPNGAFEFRYGTMDPSPNGGSSCYPTSDCVGDANGASATIGYQDPSGARGHLLHIGGAGQTSSNRPFPGGLAGRSFRVDPTVTAGSWTFTADASKRMEVCAVASGFAACEPVHVEVLGAGTAILTEVMIAPSGGGAQWFEVRNTSLATLDLQGFEITTNTGSHTIADPVVVPPGGFAVFSRGATAGLQADYAYDASVAMDPSGDTLAIQSGTLTVTQASWDGSLPLPPGQSLELDALAHSRHAHTLDAQSAFCLPVTSYDGGANLGTPGWMGGTCMPGVTSDYTVDTLHHGTVFDIQSTGTTLLTGIEETTQVDLGFAFPYFGEDVTRLWVMSGAFVTVRSSTNAYTNQRLPHSGSQASAGIISPFWDDFYFSTHGASVKWEERSVGGQQVAIFEWHRARPWDASTSNHRLTIQLQLWQDGRIVFAYRDLAGFHGDVFGGSSTIGIQEPTSSDPRYMLYSYNRASISEGQMIEFTPAP